MDKLPKILVFPFIVLVVAFFLAINLFCDLTLPIYKFFKGIKDE
jgi:hypothetical protein